MTYKREFKSFDYSFFIVIACLCVTGIILIGSATGMKNGTFSSIFVNQIIWFVTGIGVMALASFVDFRFICKFHVPVFILNVSLLAATLILKRVTGDSLLREIRIGSFGIMPSEFNKIFMLIYLAGIIDKFKEKINNFFVLLFLLATGLIPFVLIAMQPSLSASFVSIIILVAMLYIGGIGYRYIIAGVVVSVFALGFLYYDLHSENPIIVNKIFRSYQIEERILPFLNSEEFGDADERYQIEQAMFAMGSGGVSGKGLYNNETHIPKAYNDFIFAQLGAELGFIGCVCVLGAMLFVIVKCLIISMKSDIFMGRLIAGGVACIFAFQVFVNAGVNIGMLPNTGMAFPFLSSGGSTMWINMSLVGLCVNVKMTKPKSMFDE